MPDQSDGGARLAAGGGSGVSGAYPVPAHSHPFSQSFIHSLPSLYHPMSIPQCPRRGQAPALCVCVALWLAMSKRTKNDLDKLLRSGLRGFNSMDLCQPRSIFHRPPKITNILLYTLVVTRNVSVILFRVIPFSETSYALVLFQSC